MAQRSGGHDGGRARGVRPTPRHVEDDIAPTATPESRHAQEDAAAPTAAPKPRQAEQEAAPAPRNRPPRPAGPPPGTRRARNEARDAALRETLEPYAPGERPRAVLVAIALALVLAVVNLALLASGHKVEGKSASPLSGVLFALVMFAAAGGMWRMRYWAVLGFQALVGLAVVFFSLFLVRASNLLALAICLFVIGGGGWLFWKLVRVMSRLQVPGRPRR